MSINLIFGVLFTDATLQPFWRSASPKKEYRSKGQRVQGFGQSEDAEKQSLKKRSDTKCDADPTVRKIVRDISIGMFVGRHCRNNTDKGNQTTAFQ